MKLPLAAALLLLRLGGGYRSVHPHNIALSLSRFLPLRGCVRGSAHCVVIFAAQRNNFNGGKFMAALGRSADAILQMK